MAAAIEELPALLASRGWDLHLELAGAFARSGAGEGPALWVASVSRGDFALEAQARHPADALEGLLAEIRRFGTPPAPTRHHARSA